MEMKGGIAPAFLGGLTPRAASLCPWFLTHRGASQQLLGRLGRCQQGDLSQMFQAKLMQK